MGEFVTFAVRLDVDLDDFDSCPITAAAVSACFLPRQRGAVLDCEVQLASHPDSVETATGEVG